MSLFKDRYKFIRQTFLPTDYVRVMRCLNLKFNFPRINCCHVVLTGQLEFIIIVVISCPRYRKYMFNLLGILSISARDLHLIRDNVVINVLLGVFTHTI